MKAPSDRLVRILLTYFGAFDGVEANPTEKLAKLLAESFTPHTGQIELVIQELPVVFDQSSQLLCQRIEDLDPDIVIATGVAVGRQAVSLERVAINLDDARIADNSGDQRKDQPIRAEGPAAYFSTLPTRDILEAGR